jgi:single-strand DNA-binding protein
MKPTTCFAPAHILLPSEQVPLEQWGCIACDQFTSDRSYWQRAEKTEWVNVVVWGKPAEFCANYLSKGRLVFVEGRMETRKWQDKSGTDRYTTEINASQVTALDKGENKPPQREVRQDMDSMDDSPF